MPRMQSLASAASDIAYMLYLSQMETRLEQIGPIIAKIREEKRMTQKALAGAIKTTQSAVARMEKGEQNLTTEMLARVSRALKTEILSIASRKINLKIDGGKKLSGTITTNTSKNGAVGLLCASLLNSGVTVLKNMPNIEEVNRIIEVLQSIGVKVSWKGNSVVIVRPKRLSLNKMNLEAATKTRSIVMFLGPLIHSLRSFSLPNSGGCLLGLRSIRPHHFALETLGVTIETKPTKFLVKHNGLNKNKEIILYEPGDTVTENALMAASLIMGTTTIKYASANYQVQEMCFFLEKLGVKIDGIGTTTLVVHGVKEIDERVEYEMSEDPTDTMFFLTAAILTKSAITIKRCPIEFLELELLTLEKMGFKYTKTATYLSKNGRTKLVDIKTKPSRLVAPPEKIHPLPYPGLNIDNLPFFVAIATQAKGQTLIHDWVYEKRALYYTELDKLGAQTVLADPHRIYITGPSKLKATELICPPALRPATIILICMLAAEGTSVLRDIYSINRGYENLTNRLSSIGASVGILHDFTS